MRRIALCATLVALALAGCAPPGGTDGDLVDDWAPIAAATGFTPEAGTCHRAETGGYRSTYAPYPCDESHLTETLHVGTLTGADAAGSRPPTSGSDGMRAAYATCHREANEALGADWRSGRIDLYVMFPSPAGWRGGSRWFRCEVSEVRSLDDLETVPRSASLVGALKGDSPLRHTCFEPKADDDDVLTGMTAVSCTSRHHAEFVGVWTAPDTDYATFKRNDRKTGDGCSALIAEYAGVPRGDLKYRSGWIYYEPTEEQWRNGERGVRCFLYVDGRSLTRSMKGAGKAGLPAN